MKYKYYKNYANKTIKIYPKCMKYMSKITILY